MGPMCGAHRDAFKRRGVEGSVDLGGDLWGWAIGLIYGAGLGYGAGLWGQCVGLTETPSKAEELRARYISAVMLRLL